MLNASATEVETKTLEVNRAATYQRIERGIAYLVEQRETQPDLGEVAHHAGLSPFHFHRLFVAWAGVTPKEFVQMLTLERAKVLLKASASVIDAALESGLSGSSRLHDLFVNVEKMTPGEYKQQALGMRIYWARSDTPVGNALFAATERGLCHIAFIDTHDVGLDALQENWPLATLVEAPAELAAPIAEVVQRMQGLSPVSRLGILLKGSDLRLQVWSALLRVPRGAVVSYGQLAQLAHKPTAVRAVASSLAANPLAFLIPCHRVIRSTGMLGEYHWGAARKFALLGKEQLTQVA